MLSNTIVDYDNDTNNAGLSQSKPRFHLSSLLLLPLAQSSFSVKSYNDDSDNDNANNEGGLSQINSESCLLLLYFH